MASIRIAEGGKAEVERIQRQRKQAKDQQEITTADIATVEFTVTGGPESRRGRKAGSGNVVMYAAFGEWIHEQTGRYHDTQSLIDAITYLGKWRKTSHYLTTKEAVKNLKPEKVADPERELKKQMAAEKKAILAEFAAKWEEKRGQIAAE